MKNFIQRIQNLSQKAAELKEAVQQVPPKVAGLGQAVALTATQLQQTRAQIQASLLGLKTDREDQLLDALREIEDSRGLLRQAGYELDGVDLELSPIERLIVHLDRRETVRQSVLEALRDAAQARRTTHAILAALVRAEETANNLRLAELDYRALVVHVGPVPTVRLCWRPRRPSVASRPAPMLAGAAPTAPEPAPARRFFFGAALPQVGATAAHETFPNAPEPKPEPIPPAPDAPSPERPPTSVPSAAPPAPSRSAPLAREAPPAWNSDALQRFKTMPSGSKYRRARGGAS